MIIALGTKVGNRYSRFTPSFENPIEFGISLSLGDHKFLEAYKSQTLSGAHLPAVDKLIIEDADFNCLEQCPNNFIQNLDNNRIPNGFIGPSSDSQSDSTGITQMRPMSAHSATQISISRDVNLQADTLRMYMADHDSIIVPKMPTDWISETDSTGLDGGSVSFPGTPRKPEMINIPNHSNTLLFNLIHGSNSQIDIYHPITGKINPEFSYRYSFFYRAKLIGDSTAINVTPYIQYFKANEVDGDLPISTSTYPVTALTSSLTATESTDFSLFQLAIPRFGSNIPSNAQQMRIILKFELVSSKESDSSALDFCYPVLEHAVGIGSAQGYVFVPYAPSNFGINLKYPTKKTRSEINTPLIFDTTRLFKNHPGRKLYNVNMDFSITDSTYAYELRYLENFNKMGYKIAFRPKHPNLPPVLIGDLDVSISHPTYDYNVNDISISFTEAD